MRSLIAVVAVALCLSSISASANNITDDLSWSGDLRLRLENDWDSQRADGSEREDRLRARIRLRFGFQYRPDEHLEIGVRVRSGSDDSQGSPYITIVDFDDNDTEDADFNFDKWYIKGEQGRLWGWAGRNSLPIWKPNEIFWDDDVTPAGFAAGYDWALGDESTLDINAGYFSLPAGMRGFCGNMAHVQGVFKTRINQVALTAAGGYYDIDGSSSGDSDCDLYLQDNGQRDYQIWVGNLQAQLNDVSIGFDYMHNSEDYMLGEPGITATNVGESDGWDIYATVGSTRERGDWLVGWWYVRIEQFAVNNSFSQDDWVRWGSATQTRGSDLKGHEFRLGYGLGKNMNLLTRLYLADAITSIEDGNRLRVDFNYSF